MQPHKDKPTPAGKSSDRNNPQAARSWWNVVVGPADPDSGQDRQTLLDPASSALDTSTGDDLNTQSRPLSRDGSHSPRPIPIAPNGPVHAPREDSDGYRFKCSAEGCDQKYRHRSSRSRHKRKCHKHES